jgi:hypothetical protein
MFVLEEEHILNYWAPAGKRTSQRFLNFTRGNLDMLVNTLNEKGLVDNGWNLLLYSVFDEGSKKSSPIRDPTGSIGNPFTVSAKDPSVWLLQLIRRHCDDRHRHQQFDGRRSSPGG